jgi:hypothetical protein
MEPGVNQLLAAMAARELSSANLIDALARKIDALPLDINDPFATLSQVRAMAQEFLRAVSELERTQTDLLMLLLGSVDATDQHED